jgi:cAMP-binding proteins - catabolite gene activator and regulatory subunit of cAMP-dependent protein kinases
VQDPGQVADIPVTAGSVRWERPTARSFWNALADPERRALAAAGVEEFFRGGAVLCGAGEDTSQVMIIDSGWVKVSVRTPMARRSSPSGARGTWWGSGPRSLPRSVRPP